MKHCFYFIISLAVLLTSCDYNNTVRPKTFWMDNPTSSSITVVIDETNYELPANSGVNVELNFGKHSMTYNGETINFVVKPNDQNCVINPTLSNYIFFNEIYVVEGKEDKAAAEYEKTKDAYLYPLVLENNDTISVPFKVIQNTLFIEQYQYYWHFGVTEPYTDVRLDMGGTSSATINRSKLFRESDFIDYVGKEKLPEGFVIKPSTMKLGELPVYELVPSAVIAGCPFIKDDLEKIKAKFDSLQIMTDGARFRTLTSYELYNNMGDVWHKSLKVKDEGADDCGKSIKFLLDRKPSFGQMNAYIVK